MNEKDKKFYVKWRRKRAKGVFKYIAWRAIVWGVVLAIFKVTVNLMQVAMASGTQEEFMQYLLTGVWMNMLISFVGLTLLSTWGLWIYWDGREKRFMTLSRTMKDKDIPADYSIPSPRGVKEKFPDYDWERRGK